MALEWIDSKSLKKIFIAGANHLNHNKKHVDELNVFPVPDGDTGSNMSLTILAAAQEVENANESDMSAVAKAISSGSLRGARGNSGVILSQLLRGFTKEIKNVEKIDTAVLANAMQKAVETAYKAVMKPKEGTILTVAKGAAKKAATLAIDSDDIVYVFEETIAYAKEVLKKTPDMLPVLKQAGVVDAGGQGLLYIMEGCLAALKGNSIVTTQVSIPSQTLPSAPSKSSTHLNNVTDDIEFGYCTVFMVYVDSDKQAEKESESLKEYLATIGDSLVVVADEEIIKVHVHTNIPGTALQRGLEIGQLSGVKIENMRLQSSSNCSPQQDVEAVTKEIIDEPKKEIGFVVVSVGQGLNEIFKGLGADSIIEGGQTMNPSTEDLLQAVDRVHAENIFVLPNNKNIILAAQQAREMCKDKNIIVIPSKTIPQGITAMINYEHEKSVSENAANMEDSMNYVSTGQLTFAVRDTNIDEKDIHEGDILGIGNGKILAVKKELDMAARELISQLVDEDSELVTIYYGQDVNENTAEALAEYIENNFEDCDVEIHYGGQPLYYYILSVE